MDEVFSIRYLYFNVIKLLSILIYLYLYSGNNNDFNKVRQVFTLGIFNNLLVFITNYVIVPFADTIEFILEPFKTFFLFHHFGIYSIYSL